MIDRYLNATYKRMKNQREEWILNHIPPDRDANILILGAAEGVFVEKLKQRIPGNYYMVEIHADHVNLLREQGFAVEQCDLNLEVAYPDQFFNTVVADQVIEHLYDPDQLLKEIHRVMKPNAVSLISTENLASWANILSLVLGYYPLSLDYSSLKKIGNPLSPHYRKPIKSSFACHIKVPTQYAFKEIASLHGLIVEREFFNGFFPLPGFFARVFKRYSYFQTYLLHKSKEKTSATQTL